MDFQALLMIVIINQVKTSYFRFIVDLTETFEQIKEAQQDAAEDAMKAIEAASMKVATLIQQIIDEAADADHSGKISQHFSL